jgi:hypothetical protein
MERAEESFRPRGLLKRKAPRRRLALAAAALSLALALASLLVYAKSRREAGPYALADDCPHGALVYAQASDLPGLLQLWDNSRLKERYLASESYRQFAQGHVALKLAARAGEFGEAIGFAPDAGMLAEVADRGAAIAVYDIGRMELVFIAPVGEEKATAARLFQNAESFEQTELPDGTVYYSRDVEADRGRQKQKVLFAFTRGRFVLATDERLMLRALANVNGKSHADRLSDDPSFKTLSRALAPHFASVWVDQSRLNADYYFKHYWAMSDASTLKGIRAGLFDFEAREGSWLERREFLLEGLQRRAAALSRRDLQELGASVPAEAAYVRLSAFDDGGAGASSIVANALLERTSDEGGEDEPSGRLHEGFDPAGEGGADYARYGDYTYLGGDYDEAIDEPSDSEENASDARGGVAPDDAAARLERTLANARPSVSAVAETAVAHEGPLFVEFRRLAILRLGEPGRLDASALEESIASLAAGRLTAAGTAAELRWSDAGEGARRRRELEMPMLGWKLCYALRGRDLFVSNDAAFLDSALAGGGEDVAHRAGEREGFDDLTLIRLDHRAEAFDGVFSKLDERRSRDSREGGAGDTQDARAASEEFFSGNVSSLLDAASAVARVEIRRRSTPGRLHEEVEMSASNHR